MREYLGARSGIEIVAECGNGFEAVKAITELKPDLVFLDIQMPKLDGFEVIELLDDPPGIIFITAYDQYALKAFEVHAIDYLLKPFTLERFEEALSHALQRLGQNNRRVFSTMVSDARPKGEPLQRVLIREGSRVLVVPIDKIDYFEAQDDYVAIRSEGKPHLKHQRLNDLEAALDPQRFVRIHRSYILNVDRLVKIELSAKDSRVAILKDGVMLPVSRAGYEKLKRLL